LIRLDRGKPNPQSGNEISKKELRYRSFSAPFSRPKWRKKCFCGRRLQHQEISGSDVMRGNSDTGRSASASERKILAGKIVHCASGTTKGAAYGFVAKLLPEPFSAGGLPFDVSHGAAVDGAAVPAPGRGVNRWGIP